MYRFFLEYKILMYLDVKYYNIIKCRYCFLRVLCFKFINNGSEFRNFFILDFIVLVVCMDLIFFGILRKFFKKFLISF